MDWGDIVMAVMSATLANHLGLVEAVEGVVRHRIPVLNCSRCATFWLVLALTLCGGASVLAAVTVSFVCSLAAVWLELGLGYIDILYNRIYESLYPSKADDAADTEAEVS